jgi:hypothetical protein
MGNTSCCKASEDPNGLDVNNPNAEGKDGAASKSK